MPRGALTGSRIRDRRVQAGLKQADVAKAAGISASYLNLIEHNKRRIGGKVLADIAKALGCDVTVLSEGAEAALIGALREAAAGSGAELAKLEEFAGRFPGWAALTAGQHERIGAIQGRVEALNDRLAHDPNLSAALHELLTAVTAIRSTTSILAGTEDLDPNWVRRFLATLDAEGRRLAGGAEALVRYFDASGPAAIEPGTPQEEVEAFFEARGWHLDEIEQGAAPQAVVSRAEELRSSAGRALAFAAVERYAEDARRLPLAALAPFVSSPPGAITERFGASPDVVLRRLAMVPGREAGLVIADGAGAITFRRPISGFPLPKQGAGCGLWPLYQALTRPAQPLRATLEMPGDAPRRMRAEAVAMPRGGGDFGAPTVFETTMLLTPTTDAPGHPVGSTCRICPREVCPARREPSILG